MKVIICLSGSIDKEILKKECREARYIIAADGGGNALYNNNIIPDVLLGDLDSISDEALSYFKEKDILIEKYPAEKDYTDGELALIKAVTLNPDEVVFLGAIGSRMDHVFGNINLLYKAMLNNIEGKIVDKNNIIMLSDKGIVLEKFDGFKFSIIPYNGCVEMLTIEGGKYDLNNYTLNTGETITISNEFKDENVKISFKKGTILLIISKDDDF